MPRDENLSTSTEENDARAPVNGEQNHPEPLFYLTGFVDGLVDFSREEGKEGSENETLVMEMKHRMNKCRREKKAGEDGSADKGRGANRTFPAGGQGIWSA